MLPERQVTNLTIAMQAQVKTQSMRQREIGVIVIGIPKRYAVANADEIPRGDNAKHQDDTYRITLDEGQVHHLPTFQAPK